MPRARDGARCAAIIDVRPANAARRPDLASNPHGGTMALARLARSLVTSPGITASAVAGWLVTLLIGRAPNPRLDGGADGAARVAREA
jgi:hypothetical protein